MQMLPDKIPILVIHKLHVGGSRREETVSRPGRGRIILSRSDKRIFCNHVRAEAGTERVHRHSGESAVGGPSGGPDGVHSGGQDAVL